MVESYAKEEGGMRLKKKKKDRLRITSWFREPYWRRRELLFA